MSPAADEATHKPETVVVASGSAMRHDKLSDLLAPDLRLVFVGTAAGRRSAEVGHYYAGPGNRFWRTLHWATAGDRARIP